MLNYVQQSGGIGDKTSSSISTKAEPVPLSMAPADISKGARLLMNNTESNKAYNSSKNDLRNASNSFAGNGGENQREASSSPAPVAKKLNSSKQENIPIRYNSPASFYDSPHMSHHLQSPHNSLVSDDHQSLQGFTSG